MMRIPATTSLCILICLAACSDDPKGPTSDGGGASGLDAAAPGGGVGGDSGAPGGGAQGGNAGGSDGGGGAAAGGGDGGGAAGGSDGGGGAAGGGDGGRTDGGTAAGGGDGGQQLGCDPGSAPNVGELKLQTVVSGVSRLMYAAQAPGSNDWYLVQQNGQIKVLPAGASMPNATPFLDVNTGGAVITAGISGEDERGLLSIAFARDYATSGLFYVMLTPNTGGEVNRDTVRQYKKDGDNVTLQETLLTLPASAVNHNGGQVVIGPDNMLYVGTGDGGGSCNSSKAGAPQLISGSDDALFGKILRLDPSNAPSYAAAGNPFTESPLVLHYGLRNPFRFGFDRANGDLYIGDVGQDSYEELDFAKSGVKGLNFGWAAYEAKSMTCGGRTLRAGSQHTEPIHFGDRRAIGCSGQFCDWTSSIGGVVYRGAALPQLVGVYLYGDYKGARMVALRQCDSGTSPVRVIRKHCEGTPGEACFNGTDFSDLIAIVEDNAGEVYFVADKSSLLKLVAGP
jgi:glucose/arabinose dehydrogenase